MGAQGRERRLPRLNNKLNRGVAEKAADSPRAFPEGDGLAVVKEGRAEAEGAARAEEGQVDR